MKRNPILLSLILILISLSGISQQKTCTVFGSIKDEKGENILFASIFVEERQLNATTNENGEFSFSLPPGEYMMIVQHINYETVQKKISLPASEKIEIVMKQKIYTLPQVIVTKKKEDPAYRIMRQAIAKAPYHRKQLSYYKAETYGKSIMKIVEIPKYLTKMAKLADEAELGNIKSGDLFVRENISTVIYNNDSINQNVKSIRNSFPESLDISGFDDFSMFNIYRERRDYITPLSKQALSVYNFRLISSVRDKNDFLIYKIEFSPKNNNPYAFFGHIYIVDGSWHVQHFDMTTTINLGVAKSVVNIKQNFGKLALNIWVPVTSYMKQSIKMAGVNIDVSLATSIQYLDFKVNKNLIVIDEEIPVAEKPKETQSISPKVQKIDDKINELITKDELSNRDAVKLATLVEERTKVEEKENSGNTKPDYEIRRTRNTVVDSNANFRDSIYWEQNRQLPLSKEETFSFEERVRKDSIKKTNFVDAVTKATNKSSKKHNIYYGVNQLNQYFEFNPVDGVKLKPGLYITKEFKDTTQLRWTAGAGYSFGQKKFIFYTSLKYDYLPEKRASISLSGGKESWDFNTETAITPLGNTLGTLFFKNNAKNYYDRAYIELNHRFEPFNGFNTLFSFAYEWRAKLENRSDYAFFYKNKRDYMPNIPDNQYIIDDPSLVDGGEGAVMKLQIEYTPKTYYRYSHRRKINYQSKLPTISFVWKKGILGLFGSDTQFDYIELGIRQRVSPNILHTFYYNVTGGVFPAKGQMHFSEFKHIQIYKFPLTLGPLYTTIHTQEVYNFASNEWYAAAFFRYEALYLLFKFIPGLNRTLMTENVYLSYSKTPISGHYIEMGYSLDQIFMFFKVGVFVGFNDFKYHGWSLKFALDLP